MTGPYVPPPRPRPDSPPPTELGGAVVQAGTTLRTGLLILAEGATGFSGIFGYSPSPGAGNLIFSVAAAAGTDPWGNPYPAGLSITGAGSALTGDDWILNSAGMFFYGGAPALGNLLGSWAQAPGIDQFGNPYNPGLQTYGTLAAINPNSGGTPETWHSMAGLGANGFTVNGASYTLLPVPAGRNVFGGGVALKGNVTTPSSGSYNGVVAATLGGGYHPGTATRWPVMNTTNLNVTGYAVLNTDGTIVFQGLPSGYNSKGIDITGTAWLF